VRKGKKILPFLTCASFPTRENFLQSYFLTRKNIQMKKFLFVILSTFSCNSSEDHTMTDQSAANKARTQQFYNEVINAHNIAAIDSFCTSDFLDHNPDEGHSGKGIEDLKAQFTAMFASIPDVKVNTDFMVAKGDTVVSHVTMTGTNTGAMGSMPATNKTVNITGIDIIVIKDGKATERWGEFDRMAMAAQLGMMPPPDASKMTDKK
jgi:steroid delta-isomerase-like uncharacterized protein